MQSWEKRLVWSRRCTPLLLFDRRSVTTYVPTYLNHAPIVANDLDDVDQEVVRQNEQQYKNDVVVSKRRIITSQIRSVTHMTSVCLGVRTRQKLPNGLQLQSRQSA